MILTVHVHCTGSISNHCVIFTMCIVQNSAIGIGARNRKITAPHCSRHFCTRSISRYFFGLVIDRARGTLKSGICLCILCILRVRNNGHCQLGACVKKPPAPSAPPQAPPRPIQTKLALVSSTDPAPDPNPRIHEAPTGSVKERTFSKMLFANCQSGIGSGAAA